jgi:hypothetical protein
MKSLWKCGVPENLVSLIDREERKHNFGRFYYPKTFDLNKEGKVE